MLCYTILKYKIQLYQIFLCLQSVTKMIQEACSYVEKTPNQDVKLKLIDTLRTVTEGKVNNTSLLLMRLTDDRYKLHVLSF